MHPLRTQPPANIQARASANLRPEKHAAGAAVLAETMQGQKLRRGHAGDSARYATPALEGDDSGLYTSGQEALATCPGVSHEAATWRPRTPALRV